MFPVMVFSVVQQGFDSWLGEAPGTGVQRLFLSPDDGFCIGVHVEVFFQLGPGEGVQLFDSGDGDGVEFMLGAVFV